LLVCVCAVVSACASAQAAGGPLHCKSVFVGPEQWDVSSLVTPEEFNRVQANADHPSASRERLLKGLETYFQKSKGAGSAFPPPSLLDWNFSSLVEAHRTQLPYLQCFQYPFGSI
jgi:hypothetical protein